MNLRTMYNEEAIADVVKRAENNNPCLQSPVSHMELFSLL